MRLFRFDDGEVLHPQVRLMFLDLDTIVAFQQIEGGLLHVILSSGDRLALSRPAFDRLFQAWTSK